MTRPICYLAERYTALTRRLELATPFSLLLFRLWVALDFWHAGLAKWADPAGTLALFQSEYHVPLLPAEWAAPLGTMIELVLPWLLGLGLAGRASAAVLFVYNIVAVISYPDLWPHGLWQDFWGGGFIDHKVWGMLLLALTFSGPGKLSVDAMLAYGIKRARIALRNRQ
ncbi:DoxX family protein [Paludibacterium purpuratum]|uniref:Putative oxidoreductase n=1 Tax=Paludibacterium purpuratum TaxID=1144873 RepID=A0A4R7B0K4_9NEIS|nr:DoxX family protein [Paludibacterium purpuratum]TDR76446.1 putative oxidoreductase [Paludibacterium purpuratum]